MLAKTEERRPFKDGGQKRKRLGEGGEGGEGGGGGGGERGRGGEGGGERRRGGEGGDGGGARKRLDALSVGYFRRVGERLSEGFADEEERAMFVENVLAEVRGKASLVAMDVTGSIALQRLLPVASPAQVGALLAELGGESGSEFKAVSCDKCGGHVMESALRQASRWAERSPLQKEQTEEEEEEEEKEEEGAGGMLEAQVLCVSRVVGENGAEFIRNTHGSHVVRTLIHVLAGCLGPDRTDTRQGARDRNVAPPLTDFEAPASFWSELKNLSSALMSDVSASVTDGVASAAFQTMLTVCHRKRPKLCKQLLKGLVEYLTSLSSAPGVSPLLVFLKDAASSRLLETLLQLAHKALLRHLYRNHLRGQLVTLAVHPIANFPVQRLIAASTNYKMFVKVFDELLEGVEAVLAAGHMGVIVALAESCAAAEERQAELMRCLLDSFHCAEPASRQTSCLPLFMSLLTYEVYYQAPPAGGDIHTQRPLSSICYHGSRLVQSLARFKDRSLLLKSLRSLTPADLLTLGTDQSGSHVLQAIITKCSDKGRGKILKRLEGQYVQMSCSRFGSRVLEAVWNSATVSQRQGIAQELVPSEAQLRSDQFARHVWAKFALTHFLKRRAQWQEVQTGQSKKRKLFSDILD